MIFLCLSILTSTILNIILKSFAKYNVNTFQAIVVNYWICTFTGGIIENYYTPFHIEAIHSPWFLSTIFLGLSFIILFNLMGWTAQKLGLTVVSVANKLSLIIPVMIAFIYFGEKVTVSKISAIVLAIVAVLFVTIKKEKKDTSTNISPLIYILPIILFLGSGFNDSLINFVIHSTGLTELEKPTFVIWIFQIAAILGTLILLLQIILKKQKFEFKSIIAGVCLGVPNYFSMYYLVKSLADSGLSSTVVFPINNVLIVIFSSFSGIVLFREKLTKLQIVGIVLACIAIIILSAS
jgi:drug/metabolite transporter (DMT)-like permease